MTENHDIYVSQDSDFVTRSPYFLHDGNREIQTIFNNNEAIRICQGITNIPSLRRILVRHFQNKLLERDDILEIHHFAMGVVEKYGLREIERIIQLPPLSFMFGGAEKMFVNFDLMKSHKMFPEVRLLSSDGDIVLLKFYGKFVRSPGQASRARGIPNPEDKVILHSNFSNEPLICIYRSGIGEFLGTDSSMMRSYLHILDGFCNDMRGSVAHYGLEMGYCSFCNRPLSDERSIQVGYGPQCARSSRLPWGKIGLGSRINLSRTPNRVAKYSSRKQQIVKVIPRSSRS
jgi:hypothetical protein